MKRKFMMTTAENRSIAPGITSLVLRFPEDDPEMRRIQEQIVPGQFVGVYPRDGARLLPRPISICKAGNGWLRIVFREVKDGTRELAALKEGDQVSVIGILGNGYDLSLLRGKKVLLLGGGIGIPPMLELAAALHDPENVTAILGYRDSNLFLKEEFEAFAKVLIATEDGSVGTKGTVLDVAAANGLTPEAVCACGPMPMLRAVKCYARKQQAACFISLEERMACGVGVCLGCVCRTVKKDEHSQVNNTRICTEGPVFAAEDVDI